MAGSEHCSLPAENPTPAPLGFKIKMLMFSLALIPHFVYFYRVIDEQLFSAGLMKMAGKLTKYTQKKWSQKVTQESSALDLEDGVFTWNNPKKIAESLKKSADSSTRRKATPFRSAMSMLVFYINRAGRNLDKEQLKILENAKHELRRLYGRL